MPEASGAAAASWSPCPGNTATNLHLTSPTWDTATTQGLSQQATLVELVDPDGHQVSARCGLCCELSSQRCVLSLVE